MGVDSADLLGHALHIHVQGVPPKAVVDLQSPEEPDGGTEAAVQHGPFEL